uniref:Uncharacterized protein n=1 Tax=Solanum lycopersicum TaxID=4081 RepID=A0A3Q7ER84_SOLLC
MTRMNIDCPKGEQSRYKSEEDIQLHFLYYPNNDQDDVFVEEQNKIITHLMVLLHIANYEFSHWYC